MPDAHAHPHSHHGHDHAEQPPVTRHAPVLRASWLRHSALQRLAGAGVAIALIWAAVLWALQ